MVKTLERFVTRIPTGYKDDCIRDINKRNLSRSIITTIVIIVLESAIFVFFRDRIFNTGRIVAGVIVFSVLFLPVLSIGYRRYDRYRTAFIGRIHYVYLLGMLGFACALSVTPQAEFVSISTYIIAAFAIAAFMCVSPAADFVLYFSVYAGFYIVLPYYQPRTDVVAILRINAFFMSILAWVLSAMVYRMRIASFVDKKVIEEKNLILKDLAIRDSMTNLLNHDNSYKQLLEEIERAKRIRYPLSVIMMDIDDFKHVNDRYGHPTGDDVIVGVAKILLDTCRSTDTVGRYGGEEYIAIMPNTTSKDAAFLAERIRSAVEASRFRDGIHVTLSGGISELHDESASELIKAADLQLYKAKCNGKNRFEIAGIGGQA